MTNTQKKVKIGNLISRFKEPNADFSKSSIQNEKFDKNKQISCTSSSSSSSSSSGDDSSSDDERAQKYQQNKISVGKPEAVDSKEGGKFIGRLPGISGVSSNLSRIFSRINSDGTMFGFGQYPPGYNGKVHGPYDPARYYGKPDTPFSQVKLSELAGWFGRRKKTPHAFSCWVSRGYWKWQHKYWLARNSGVAPLLQVVTTTMILSYILNYHKFRYHYWYKYH